MTQPSGVGVVAKTVAVLDALAPGPASLAELVDRSGLARPTAYRIAVSLESHRLLRRDADGKFALGPRIGELAAADSDGDQLLAVAGPVLERLRETTRESVQIYRRVGSIRRCVAVAERASGLRDTVPLGADLSMTAGSAAQVLLAWEPARELGAMLRSASFTASTLAGVRRRGWAASVAEREAGVASVSAPIRDLSGRVVAAVSVSGPIERLTRSPGRLHAAAVLAAAATLSASDAR